MKYNLKGNVDVHVLHLLIAENCNVVPSRIKVVSIRTIIVFF